MHIDIYTQSHRKNTKTNYSFYSSVSKSKYNIAHTYCVDFKLITDML